MSSFDKCSNETIPPGLVCFAWENYKIVPKNCNLKLKALYVKGIILINFYIRSKNTLYIENKYIDVKINISM